MELQAVLRNNVVLLRDEKGVGLVEVMIALVVLLFVMMGLLQAALLSIDHNLRNLERDEAVRIADQRMNGILVDKDLNVQNGLRLINFSALDGMATPPPGVWTAPFVVQRNFRDFTRTYNVVWRIERVDAETMRITVAVGWNHRNENPLLAPTGTEFVHQITTLRRTT